MNPRILLRAEGLAAFLASTAVFFSLDGPLWLYLLLALAPDLSMVGYAAGPRVGSYCYNAAHTYVAPLALAGLGLRTGYPLAVLVAAVWAAHVGMDRLVGYGLKFPDSFDHTHLSAAESRTALRTVENESAP